MLILGEEQKSIHKHTSKNFEALDSNPWNFILWDKFHTAIFLVDWIAIIFWNDENIYKSLSFFQYCLKTNDFKFWGERLLFLLYKKSTVNKQSFIKTDAQGQMQIICTRCHFGIFLVKFSTFLSDQITFQEFRTSSCPNFGTKSIGM